MQEEVGEEEEEKRYSSPSSLVEMGQVRLGHESLTLFRLLRSRGASGGRFLL
jgi:hypothetical protein